MFRGESLSVEDRTFGRWLVGAVPVCLCAQCPGSVCLVEVKTYAMYMSLQTQRVRDLSRRFSRCATVTWEHWDNCEMPPHAGWDGQEPGRRAWLLEQ